MGESCKKLILAPVGFAQRALEFLAVGDVLDHGQRARLAGDIDRLRREQPGDLATAAHAERILAIAQPSGRLDRRKLFLAVARLRPHAELRRGLADGLLARVAGNVFEGFVDFEQLARDQRRNRQAERSRVECLGKTLVAFP